MTNPDSTKVQEDGLVVNVEKMMEYVAEHKAIANDHFKTKDYPKAIGFYQICLDAINQADGLPMHVDDVLIVCKNALSSIRISPMPIISRSYLDDPS